MFNGASVNIPGDENVFISFEGTDIIQISTKNSYYDRFSSPSSNLRSMGLFWIILLLPNSQWHSRYIIDENTNYRSISKELSYLYLDFTETNYGKKIVDDHLDTTVAHMCFNNILITQSVY